MDDAQLGRIARATAYAPSGDELGKVGHVYLGDTTGEPTFVSVRTGMFGAKESLVPMSGHRWDRDKLILAYEREAIKGAPYVGVDLRITEREQNSLFAYYEAHRADAASAERPSKHVTDETRKRERDDERDSEVQVTRSEERLAVGTEEVEAERVRLRRYTTTEEETVTVPVTKEWVAVERVPLEGDADSVEPEDVEVIDEFVTREEVPVVHTETVEVEEVRLGKEVVVEEETVSGTIRKEHVDIETDGEVETDGDVRGRSD